MAVQGPMPESWLVSTHRREVQHALQSFDVGTRDERYDLLQSYQPEIQESNCSLASCKQTTSEFPSSLLLENYFQQGEHRDCLCMRKNVHRLFNREKEYDARLTNNKLTISKGGKLKAELDFDHTSFQVELSADEQTLVLQPKGNSLRFYFKACLRGRTSMAQWHQLIQSVVANSETFCQLKLNNRPYSDFKIRRISLAQFQERVKSLDLLLFQSAHLNGRLQRALTQSDYDHVALLVRGPSDIKIFDSTQGAGVTLTSWNKFIESKHHRAYSRLVLRQLHCNRDQSLLIRFLEFLKAQKGKGFAFNPLQVLRRYSSSNTEDLFSRKAFFCTQLVAGAYKYLDLLDPLVPSANYFPRDFSEKVSLNLMREAQLGEEHLIDFQY